MVWEMKPALRCAGLPLAWPRDVATSHTSLPSAAMNGRSWWMGRGRAILLLSAMWTAPPPRLPRPQIKLSDRQELGTTHRSSVSFLLCLEPPKAELLGLEGTSEHLVQWVSNPLKTGVIVNWSLEQRIYFNYFNVSASISSCIKWDKNPCVWLFWGQREWMQG